MTRSGADAALLLAAMAGSDPADPVTAPADAQIRDYAAAGATLAGKRLGVLLPVADTEADRVFLDALKALEAAGAEIVPATDFMIPPGSNADETALLQTEFKSDLNSYLATLPAGQPDTQPKNLAEIIAFNAANPRELALFGQDTFEKSQARPDLADPEYQATLARLVPGMRALLERTFAQYRLDALVQPTNGPAFRIDLVRGNNSSGSSSSVPAIAGTPHLTVPMGMVRGLPVGISLSGLAWSEAQLLALGAAVEKVLPARKAPQFLPSLETTPESRAAFAPQR
jgi:amidase